jgi:hypothetical protein
MAYLLNGTNQYFSLAINDLPVSAVPATMALRVQFASDASNNSTLIGIGATTNVRLRVFRSTQIRLDAIDDAAAGGTAVATNPGNSVWFSTAGTFDTASRIAYVNTSSGTNTASTGAQTMDRFAFGARRQSTPFDYTKGDIAEVAVWSAVLTADEIASLARGFKPSRIRPQSLAFYAPIVRDIHDLRNGRTITNNNTATVSDHPRVY